MPKRNPDHLRLVPGATRQGPAQARSAAQTLACLARIVCVQGAYLHIELPGGGTACARTTVPLHNLKDEVLVIVLADGQHVVIGQVLSAVPVRTDGEADLVLRGERVRIEAGVELVLAAGACRLQLDARGKAVTTADQIVSRARGANKLQGGTVQLN
jgi:hypothetical protein